MSSFYTNIQLAGDTILYRGYENGKSVQYRASFSPTLYVLSNKKEKFKTLDGRSVTPVKFGAAREARDFIKQYDEVQNFEVHGYERFVYQYIREEFPNEVDYNINQMKIYALDIEDSKILYFKSKSENIIRRVIKADKAWVKVAKLPFVSNFLLDKKTGK